MKLSAMLCALVASSSLFTMVPALAKDAAADLQGDEAKAASEKNKAEAQVAKGHPFRAKRAAKKAEKAHEKVEKDLQK